MLDTKTILLLVSILVIYYIYKYCNYTKENFTKDEEELTKISKKEKIFVNKAIPFDIDLEQKTRFYNLFKNDLKKIDSSIKEYQKVKSKLEEKSLKILTKIHEMRKNQLGLSSKKYFYKIKSLIKINNLKAITMIIAKNKILEAQSKKLKDKFFKLEVENITISIKLLKMEADTNKQRFFNSLSKIKKLENIYKGKDIEYITPEEFINYYEKNKSNTRRKMKKTLKKLMNYEEN